MHCEIYNTQNLSPLSCAKSIDIREQIPLETRWACAQASKGAGRGEGRRERGEGSGGHREIKCKTGDSVA